MKTKFLLLTLTIVAASFFPLAALAQASASAGISATIIAPITITKTADMDFGTIVNSATGGTVTLNPDGTYTTTGGLTLLSTVSPTPAEFDVTGEPGYVFTLILPTTPTILADDAGDTIIISNFTDDGGTGGLYTVAPDRKKQADMAAAAAVPKAAKGVFRPDNPGGSGPVTVVVTYN